MSQDEILPTRRHFIAAMAAMSAVPGVAAAQSAASTSDVAKAMEAMRAAIPLASKDPERPIYTSIGHPQPEQWMALPEDDDLIRWRKFSGNPVLSMAAHGGLAVDQWRDPFMFQAGGRTYMVCGGNSKVQSGGARTGS